MILAEKYRSIQLKPRKYNSDYYSGYKDSLLPYFSVEYKSDRGFKYYDKYDFNHYSYNFSNGHS